MDKLLTPETAAGTIVGICQCGGAIYVACQFRVYQLVDGIFVPIGFADVKEGMMMFVQPKGDKA